MSEIVQELVKRAGLDWETIEKGNDDALFDNIIEAFKHIHRGKGFLYGDYLKGIDEKPELRALLGNFLDLERKFVRANNIINLLADGQKIELEQLLDTYSDLGVYAAMSVGLVFHLIKKNTPAQEPSDDIPF